MGSWTFVFVFVFAGCGRVGFDPIAERMTDASSATDGASDADLEPAIPPGAGIWLQMETDPQTVVIDSAGGHAAGCTGSCPTRTAGVHGFGYHFSSSQIAVAYSADLDPSAGYSAAIWFQLDAIPAGSTQFAIWSKPRDSAGGDTFTFYVDSTANINFDCDDDAGNGYSFNAGPIQPAVWHHVAVTWDGATKLGYLDGMLAGSVIAACESSPDTFDLGADYTPPDLYVAGSVDDALFYTRVLTAAEIQQLATP